MGMWSTGAFVTEQCALSYLTATFSNLRVFSKASPVT
jgi:hypothetical protein